MDRRTADILVPTRLGCVPRAGTIPDAPRDSAVAVEALRALAEALFVLEHVLRRCADGRTPDPRRLRDLDRRAAELQAYVNARGHACLPAPCATATSAASSASAPTGTDAPAPIPTARVAERT